MEAFLYGDKVGIAKDAARLQSEQIRQQQVELRLQQNQSQINRMQQLRQILAREQVTFGVRNIAPESGSVKAITEMNLQNFLQDETADRLNFAAKQQTLNIQSRQVGVEKRAQILNAKSSLLKDVENFGLVILTAGARGGYGGSSASGGAMAGGSDSMFDSLNLNA